MICYRAETSLYRSLGNYFKKQEREEPSLLKQLFNNPADLIPTYNNKTFTVVIKGLETNRYNKAIENLFNELNHTETLYPETNLKLIFKRQP